MEKKEKDYSHTHCWNNEQRNLGGVPPCGMRIEDHKQCCLCDILKPMETKELNWEEEFDELTSTPEKEGFISEWNRQVVKDFISKLRTHAIELERERIVGAMEKHKNELVFCSTQTAITRSPESVEGFKYQINAVNEIISLITQK